MNQNLFERDPRDYLDTLIQEGIISKERMIELFMCHMTKDDIAEMLDAEELSPRFLNEDENEEANVDGYDDGQPDEAQEWHDFDPDC
jgi:hypothetical protein